MKTIKTYESFISSINEDELNIDRDSLLNTIDGMVNILYIDSLEKNINTGIGGNNLTSYFPQNLIDELKEIEMPVGHEYHGYMIDDTHVLASDGEHHSIDLGLNDEDHPEDDYVFDLEDFDNEFLLSFMKILSKVPLINFKQNAEIFKDLNESKNNQN